MALEGGKELSGGRLPELDRLVRRAGGQRLAVRTPRHAINGALMALEGGKELAGGRLPELDRLVLRAGGQRLAVRTPRHAINGATMMLLNDRALPERHS